MVDRTSTNASMAAERKKKGGIMVSYGVKAERGQIQAHFCKPQPFTKREKKNLLLAVFVNSVVHKMYSLAAFQKIISWTTNSDFCLL